MTITYGYVLVVGINPNLSRIDHSPYDDLHLQMYQMSYSHELTSYNITILRNLRYYLFMNINFCTENECFN